MSGMLVRRIKRGPRGAPSLLEAFLSAATAAQSYTAYKAPVGAVWAFKSQAYGATLESGGIRFNEAGAYLIAARMSFTSMSNACGVGLMKNGVAQTAWNMQVTATYPLMTNMYTSVAAGDLWTPMLYNSSGTRTPSVGDTATAVRLWAVRTD